MPRRTSRSSPPASSARPDEWVELFDRLDVPAARYNTIDELMTDPHLKDVGFFREEHHPTEGKLRRTKPANTFSGGMREQQGHAPLMGQQTREILAEAGYGAAEIDQMLAAGAVLESPKK
jgi:crotonobetainyl-CoA:carnitine CoA-transferase CaiB-like acyl-CoA transferase